MSGPASAPSLPSLERPWVWRLRAAVASCCAARATAETVPHAPVDTEAWERMCRLTCTVPGVPPVRTVLLYGPPGTGKTAMVTRLARAEGRAMVSITPCDLMSSWVGETERRFASFFEAARMASPSILFVDEADAIFGVRGGANESEVMRRVKTQALIDLQSLLTDNDDVVLVAATNVPWDIDPAILRRFEEAVFVGLPTSAERNSLARSLLPPTLAIDAFATALEGCSCAEVVAAARAALRAPAQRNRGTEFTLLSHVSQDDLLRAAAAQRRAASTDMLARFTSWRSCGSQ